SRHAHQARHPVDLSRARSAFAGLAIPAHGQVSGVFRLDPVDRVENDHSLGDLRLVVAELSARTGASPDAKGRVALLRSGTGVTPLRSAPSALDDVSGQRLGGRHLLVLLDYSLKIF